MMEEHHSQPHLLHNPYVQDFSAYGMAMHNNTVPAGLPQVPDPLLVPGDIHKTNTVSSVQHYSPPRHLGYSTAYSNVMLPTASPTTAIPNTMYRVPLPNEVVTGEEDPLYVNAKQYHRILKRRAARARLEEKHRIQRSRKVLLPPTLKYSHRTILIFPMLAISSRIASSSCHETSQRTRRKILDCC
ncbi:Transcriptional activator, variant 2 [Basidiobolus ranarum]|uniref:Transcriptional activator HAP2 n=1 Tax=Basidiobolus ranarum TaxID=34480 RepID=A0ABR2WM11_9FUNG